MEKEKAEQITRLYYDIEQLYLTIQIQKESKMEFANGTGRPLIAEPGSQIHEAALSAMEDRKKELERKLGDI